MAAPEAGRRELVGWKEIADYLRLNTRTAQKWEAEKGLPIHRYPGEKGRVYAYSDEVEAWKEGQGEVAGSRWWQRKPLLAGLALALVAAGSAVLLLTRRAGPPADYRVEPNHFVALDGEGKELWRYRLPQAVRWTAYQSTQDHARRVRFVDLDGDFRVETLLQLVVVSPPDREVSLLCFSQDGRLKWEFRPGRKVATATQTFSADYSVARVSTLTLPARKGQYVIVTSCHAWSWPDQIVLLSPEGKMVGEYWHSGHLMALHTADVDGDGVDEILAAGVNNGQRRATLVVLDPRRLGGASIQPTGDPTQLEDFIPGTEEVIIYFPRTCITEATASPYHRVYLIQTTATSIDVFVRQVAHQNAPYYLIYRFDRKLNLLGVTPPDDFPAQHRALERAGKLDHPLGPRDYEQWKKLEVIRR